MRSGFGDSPRSYGGRNSEHRWDGLGQGSRGASHGWIHVCAPMINILRQCGLCSMIENPIMREKTETVGSVFVDDANLYSGGSVGDSMQDVVKAVAEQARAWASLLKTSGGCAKAKKSFWYLMDQVYVDGKWGWQKTEGTEMEVPVDDGETFTFKSLPLNKEKEFLGVYDSPEGGNKEQIKKISEKVSTWTTRMRNAHLPSYLGWLAYKQKLWPSVKYGIGVMTNDMEEIEDLLAKQDYETMNCLGVACTAKTGWRKLLPTFGGFGLYNIITEQTIERLNLLQQHYENNSTISRKLSTSLAYLQLQIGTNVCPFDLDYERWSYFAPLSWVKMLWRALQVSGFELHVRYDEIPLSRCCD